MLAANLDPAPLIRGIAMITNRLIEIEFATDSHVVEAANRAISSLANHLELTEYRVEPLVRVARRLVNPWDDGAGVPEAFAYRVHLGDIGQGEWTEIKDDFLRPLAQQGVAIREVRLAA